MDRFKSQKSIELSISKILFLSYFSCLKLTLVMGCCSKQPNRVSLVIIHQNPLKVVRFYTLPNEIASRGLSYQSEPESHSLCLWNAAQGLAEVLNFPNVSKPIFRLRNVEEMLCVSHYAERRTLYVACEANTIKCYNLTKETLRNKIVLRSQQEIKQLEIHKPKGWLVVRTLTNIFLIDTKTETVLNSIEVYKLPTLGVPQCFVNSVIGCTADSKKLILQIQEASKVYVKGQPTQDYAIEIYSLVGLRRDFRISLEKTPAFSAVSESLNGVIWSENHKIKGFDMKTKEVTDLLCENERVVAGVLLSDDKPCTRKKSNAMDSKPNSKPSNFVIATRTKVKIFSPCIKSSSSSDSTGDVDLVFKSVL